jgi:hypothetical protein
VPKNSFFSTKIAKYLCHNYWREVTHILWQYGQGKFWIEYILSILHTTLKITKFVLKINPMNLRMSDFPPPPPLNVLELDCMYINYAVC